MTSVWDIIEEDRRIRLRVTRWSLCRQCCRMHLRVEHDDKFVRLVHMDDTPVMHKI